MADNNDEAKPIDIDVCLKDVIAEEFASATFECMVSDECEYNDAGIKTVWFKDGKPIAPSRRIVIERSGQWHRLEIGSVTIKDQGIYLFLLKYNGTLSLSKAILYVKPVRPIASGPLYLYPAARHNIGAIKHLENTKVPVGGIIELEAKFKEPKIMEFVWFKSNRQLIEDERTIILSDDRTSTLSIVNARESDSGIYLVVCKTNYGIESSSANVIVLDLDMPTLLRSEIIPCIDEPLPRSLDVYSGEEVRLVAKVYYDNNTIITWTRGPDPVVIRQNMEIQKINNRYIALKIFCISMADGGEYTLTVRDSITGREDSTMCILLVNRLPSKRLMPTKLVEPLESAVSCVGSSLTFRCRFDVEDPDFCSASWEVGSYRVERTNQRFFVYCDGTEFYLFIPTLEPDMAGPIVCHIRRTIHGQKTLQLCLSSANLTIVPPALMQNFMTDIPGLSGNIGFYYLGSRVNVPIRELPYEEAQALGQSGPSASSVERSIFLMTIKFCKCDRNIYFIKVEAVGAARAAVLTILDITPGPGDSDEKLLLFKWTPYKDKWYTIEIVQTEDDYTGAGLSSTPSFHVKNPALEKTLNVRVRAVEPASDLGESSVVIAPPEKQELSNPGYNRIQSMDSYPNQYKETGDALGRGAFGRVILVQNEGGQYYAAKSIKTILQKRRDSARREYELLKTLEHPRLVRLHTAFSTQETFILVMDYLWGGELFDRLIEEDHIVEMDVVIYVRQICEGLRYIHRHNIAHLDMKPENIICLNPNSRLIKIADFGLARVIHKYHIIKAVYGTKDYVAPEILNYEPLSLACDMWSFGVITYLLLSGVMPFGGNNWLEFTACVNKASFNFNDPAFRDISELAKDFINKLIVLKPNERMTSAEALQHPWLREGLQRSANNSPMRRTRENLRSYLANYRERWQRAGNVMIAAHRLRNIVNGANRRQNEEPAPSDT